MLEQIFPNNWEKIEQLINEFPSELENDEFLVNKMLDMEIC